MASLSPQYAPLRAFCAPAIGHAEVWRTVVGLAITVVVYLAALRMFGSAVIALLGPLGGMLALQEISSGATPLGLVLLLFAYLPLCAGLVLATLLLMRRGLESLIGPLAPALRCFLWVALPLIGLFIALMPLQIMAPNVGRHIGFWAQLKWLPLALPALLVQTGTEELVFRGYLQQQLAARWNSPLVWMVVPAALFGSLHWSPAEFGFVAPLVVLWAVAFGMATADLTARTGNLGAAVGLHFANNAQTVFLVGLYGNLHGLALFNVVLLPSDGWAQLPYIAIDSVSLLVSWLSARLILRV